MDIIDGSYGLTCSRVMEAERDGDVCFPCYYGTEGSYYSGYGDNKNIHFYSDVNNMLSCRIFDTLDEFKKFCDLMGYVLDEVDAALIEKYYSSFCCVSNGNVIVDSTFWSMRCAALEEEECVVY